MQIIYKKHPKEVSFFNSRQKTRSKRTSMLSKRSIFLPINLKTQLFSMLICQTTTH